MFENLIKMHQDNQIYMKKKELVINTDLGGIWPWGIYEIAMEKSLRGWQGHWSGEDRNRFFYCFWQRGVPATRCFILDEKILFLAEVIEFWNLEITGNYSTHKNSKCDFLKMHIFGCMLKTCKLCSRDQKETFDLADFWFRPQK